MQVHWVYDGEKENIPDGLLIEPESAAEKEILMGVLKGREATIRVNDQDPAAIAFIDHKSK